MGASLHTATADPTGNKLCSLHRPEVHTTFTADRWLAIKTNGLVIDGDVILISALLLARCARTLSLKRAC